MTRHWINVKLHAFRKVLDVKNMNTIQSEENVSSFRSIVLCSTKAIQPKSQDFAAALPLLLSCQLRACLKGSRLF